MNETVQKASETLHLNYTQLGKSLGMSRSVVTRWAQGKRPVANEKLVGMAIVGLYWIHGKPEEAAKLYRKLCEQ